MEVITLEATFTTMKSCDIVDYMLATERPTDRQNVATAQANTWLKKEAYICIHTMLHDSTCARAVVFIVRYVYINGMRLCQSECDSALPKRKRQTYERCANRTAG